MALHELAPVRNNILKIYHIKTHTTKHYANGFSPVCSDPVDIPLTEEDLIASKPRSEKLRKVEMYEKIPQLAKHLLPY